MNLPGIVVISVFRQCSFEQKALRGKLRFGLKSLIKPCLVLHLRGFDRMSKARD